MRALVTGAGGFVGAHLVRRLRAEGAHVRALVRARTRAEALAGLGTEVVELDLARPRDLWRAVADADTVFHLAAQIRPTGEGARAYWRNNVDATRHLLVACRDLRLGAFVHVSSVGAMGALGRLPADEETPCAPDSVYGVTKREAEQLAWTAFREDGIPVVVARPAWAYGPGDRRTLRLFAAVQRRRFTLVGSGATWVHPVYVADLVEGLVRCATVPKAVGETYLLAGPEPVRLARLASLIAELLSVPAPRLRIPRWLAWTGAALVEGAASALRRRPPVYRRQLEFFLRDQRFSTRKAREELGFAPATSLREGLARTIAWYREHGLLA